MNERQKIEEAKYFLQHMVNEQNNRDNFRFETSAFLSAARSVLYYAQREVEGTRHQKWHDKRINKTQIFGEFKDIRDDNIHAEPLSMPIIGKGFIAITANATMSVRADVLRISEDSIDSQAEANIIRLENVQNVTPYQHEKEEIYNEYFFKDTDKSKNVLELCREYLKELVLFVEEGIKSGAITE